jgi:hypothetical protein
MITGAQIRQARELLGWPPTRLAQRAKVHSAIVRRAESVDGEPPVTVYQAALIRDALERFGNEFTNGEEPGVKLTKARSWSSPDHICDTFAQSLAVVCRCRDTAAMRSAHRFESASVRREPCLKNRLFLPAVYE